MKKSIIKVDSFMPDGKTKFCFLFGSNIAHSLSPKLHTSWMRSNKLNCVYLPMQIKKENDFLDILKNLVRIEGFNGANITLPFKSTILELEDLKKSEIVKKIKAANTIYKNNLGQWCLDNTDVKGIEASILKLIKPNESFEMIVLGGGGAAAAVIYCGLVNNHCKKIFCLTRSPEKTLNLYEYFKNENKISLEHLNEDNIEKIISVSNETSHKKIIINTLPLGVLEKASNESYSNENPYAIKLIKKIKPKLCCYFDLVYENTQAIKFAKTKGVKCLNGKLMLSTQAKESFFLWTGIKIKN